MLVVTIISVCQILQLSYKPGSWNDTASYGKGDQMHEATVTLTINNCVNLGFGYYLYFSVCC